IELKGVQRVDRGAFRHDVGEAVRTLAGVEWVDVNAVTRQLIIAFDDAKFDLREVVRVVEAVEEAHDLSGDRFEAGAARHPEDADAIRRSVIALGADAAGLPLAVAGRALGLVPFPAPVAALLSFVD